VFERVLVPLDGSAVAEQVLPAVGCFAERLGAAVTLVHLIERRAPAEIHGERHLRTAEEAEQYLGAIARRIATGRLAVRTHVHTVEVASVAQSIVEHAEEFASGVIALCTHGRGGLRHRLFGSIAQQVIRLGTTPVLLVPAGGGPDPAAFACRSILVPLDGDPDHEGVLPAVAALAARCAATVVLALVVPTFETLSGAMTAPSRLMPAATARLLDMSAQEAKNYLASPRRRLVGQGVRVSAHVFRGDPAAVVRRAAAAPGIDLVALATHGGTGSGALGTANLTARVCRSAGLPLLLVPVRTG